MAITANGRVYKTLSDDLYVNGAKVYEAWCNGQKVYPDNAGKLLFFIDTSGSMNADKAESGISSAYAKYGDGHSAMSAYAYGGHSGLICGSTTDLNLIVQRVRSTDFSGSGDDDNPTKALIALATDTTAYEIVAVIGDYEFNPSGVELAQISSAFEQYGMRWEFFQV